MANNKDNNIDIIYKNATPTIVDNNHVFKVGPTMVPYESLRLKVSDKSFKENSKKSVVTDSIGAPVKPSFINYCGDHFDYNGKLEYFHEQMKHVAIECSADLSYNTLSYEYDVLTYPTDQKILYAIQIYKEPKRNCYVIEFRRLDGLGFTYRDHVMSVWKELSKREIGPGIKNDIRPMMPILDMESLDKDDDYKVEAAVLKPMLLMVTSELLDVSWTGLKMLVSATRSSQTQEALMEVKAMTAVINIGLASENIEIDRLVTAVLREGVETHHEEILKNKGVELVMEKLQKSLNKNVVEILEMQRNCMLFLINLCKCKDGLYLNSLKNKGVFLIARQFTETNCKRLNNYAINVSKLLNPVNNL